MFTLQGVPASNKFVDRPFDTAGLEQCLLPRSPSRDTRRRVYVLHGLGGIGKTQLAADFTRRHQDTLSSVFWLDGSSEDRLRQSLAGYAKRIPQGQIMDRSRNLALNNEDDLKLVVADVLEWLGRPDNVGWLIIFDNVDLDHEQDREKGGYDVGRYIPGDHGSVLITTRLAWLSQLGDDSMQLNKVDQDLSKAIFQKWLASELGKSRATRKVLN